MNAFVQDVRFGLRMLRKNLGFTVMAVIALMLGIASSTVMFTVINGILLRPLPYPAGERIVTITQRTRATGAPHDAVSAANFLDWVRRSDVFAAISASRGWQGNLSGGGAPQRLRVTMVTASFFQVFAVNPILGRTLQASDEQPGHANVAVLSQGLWQRLFASDRNIIGREIHFDGEPRTVVGVMPASFSPDDYGELWVPSPFGVPRHPLRPNLDPRQVRDSNYLDAYGKLKPGVSLQQAQAQMSAIMARLEKEYPNENDGEDVVITPLQEDKVRGLRPGLLMLGGAVGFLLLIGCANVANLQLARAAARVREISIRAALGADRKRLVRQLLTESVLLSAIGGALGVFVTAWAVPILMAMGPPALSGFKDVTLDVRVLAFTVVLSVVTGIFFGLVPAFQASSANPSNSLSEGERGSTAGRSRSRSILITTQVALTLVLLVSAGLMIKSFGRLMKVDPGFNPHGLLVFDIGLPPSADDAHNVAFYQRVVERIRMLPGVAQVGAVSRLPFSGGNSSRSFNVLGSDKSYDADMRISTPEYFRTMGIPVVRGRVFTDEDTNNSNPVCVVNEATARAVFQTENPIGRYITNFGPNREKMQIVGIVGNIRHLGLDTAPRPELYQPLGQGKWPRMFVAVRPATGNPLGLLHAVQNAVSSVEPNVALGDVRTMADTIALSLSKRKFTMNLLAIFAGIAVALASIGLYGVMSYSVAQRTREIGIRMALGARRVDVLGLFVRQGMVLTILGIGLGLLGSFGLTRLISSLLFGVSATDIGTFGAVSIVLLVVALAASWWPARRAMWVEPAIALRTE